MGHRATWLDVLVLAGMAVVIGAAFVFDQLSGLMLLLVLVGLGFKVVVEVREWWERRRRRRELQREGRCGR